LVRSFRAHTATPEVPYAFLAHRCGSPFRSVRPICFTPRLRGSATAPTRRDPRQHVVPPPAPTPQEQFLVYWTTKAGWSTELLLRNNAESSPLTVTPALRTPDGAETALPSITIAPGDVASLDLYDTLMKTAPQLVGAWGSLVLRYTEVVNGVLYASAMIRADGRPIAFHLDAYARGTKYDVGSREGILVVALGHSHRLPHFD